MQVLYDSGPMHLDRDKLRKARTDANLTQEQVAKAAGMSQQAYQRLESGGYGDDERKSASFDTVYKVCVAIGCSMDHVAKPRRRGTA
jgi:transcriptional regulator with XRE-family HTH domain